ncbi:MAG: outer membrane lipoprotein chaperone LolA [Myxococcota bacterium]
MRWMRSVSLMAFLMTARVCWSPLALAEDSPAMTTAQLIEAVETAYSEVQAVKADFVQTSASAITGQTTQQGILELKRPQKARWEFTAPQKSLLVADGQKIWIYTPADNQVIVTPDVGGASNPTSDLMGLLTDLSQVNQYFDVKTTEDGDTTGHTLQLTPTDDELKAQIQTLQLTLSRDEYLLQKMVMTDAFGQVTTLEFSNVNLKAQIDDARFTFQVPDGATVIDAAGI